ncbi:hypothetical protein AURDEDRAFT_163046 [Auricularia subglabra TFB-10046 SS5]|nr:hypothetical protein AURDEDRAFT_163046 [Auricularia subglabra TFB-10046 SS5]
MRRQNLAVPDYDSAPPMEGVSFDAEDTAEPGAMGESMTVHGSSEGFDPRHMLNEHKSTMADSEGSMLEPSAATRTGQLLSVGKSTELFAPVVRGAGIALAAPGPVLTKGELVGLVMLFLKPKFSLKMREQVSRSANGEQVDEQFRALSRGPRSGYSGMGGQRPA